MKNKINFLTLFTIMVALFFVGCQEQTTQLDSPITNNNNRLYALADVPDVYDLYAGQDILVGSVEVYNNEDNLYLKFIIDDPDWCLEETHVAVATSIDGLPQTKKDNPIPGQFDYKHEDLGCETEDLYTIILTDIDEDWECDDELFIATHAVVKKVITPTPYYASSVVSYQQGKKKDGSAVDELRSNPEQGLVYETDQNPENFFSLGFGGEIIVEFDCPIINGEGNDVRIIEDTWGTYPLEIAEVWASNDEEDWTLLGTADNTTRDPDFNIHTIAEFDLGDLMWANYIKVVDISDPIVHNSNADGYDLNAVESLQDCIEEETAWGFGPRFNDDNWATYFNYITTCPSSCDEWIVFGSNLNGGSDQFDDAIYAYDLLNETKNLVYDPTPIDGNQNYPNANAYDPVNNRIYFGTDDGRLYYHEIGSGTHVQVEGGATSGSFGAMACGSWYNGKFYYIQNGTNSLYEVAIENDKAERTNIGTVPTSNGYGDIAFDPANPGVFVASAGGVWYAYDLNTSNSWVLTMQGDIPLNHLQLAYGSDGVLYGVNATTGQFFSLVYDTGTNAVTLTRGWDSPYTYTDLASGPQCQ